MAADAVVGLDGHGGLGLPQHLAAGDVESADLAVQAGAEYQLVGGQYRRRQAVVVGAAVLVRQLYLLPGAHVFQADLGLVLLGDLAAAGHRLEPQYLAAGHIECVQPGLGIIQGTHPLRVRRRHQQALARQGHAPVYPAVGGGLVQVGADAGVAHLLLPQQMAVGVQGVDIAGLLPGQQQFAAIGQFRQDDGSAEVEIAAGVGRAIGAVVETGGIPHIVCEGLEFPGQFPAVHVQGDDGIRGVGGGPGQVLPGAEIDALAFGVDGGGAPHADPGGAIDVGAGRVLALQGGVGGALPLPQLVAVAGIEGDHPAVGLATDVAGAARYRHLVGGDRHEQAVVVIADGAGDDRGLVDARGLLPDGLQARRVHRVDGRHGVGEHQQFAAVIQGRDGDGGADAAEHLGVVADTTAMAVDGVELAGLVTKVQGVADDGRLGTHVGDLGEGEAPGQFQVGHVAGIDAGHIGGQVAPVVLAQSPVGHVFGGVGGGGGIAAVLRDPLVRRGGAGQVDGDQAALGFAQVGGHGLHFAELQRHHDTLLGKASQGLAAGGVHGGVVVTAGAVLVEQFFAEVFQWQLVGVAHGKGFNGLQRWLV